MAVAITAQDMVERYMAAEIAVLDGKETMFNGRKMVMSDLADIQKGRLFWERRVASQEAAAAGRPGHALAVFP
ncbi:primosomal replication protein PriB/PriC domain protein [Pseudomonas sp. NPDC099000]|uniref:primosomal replication protein PriB/PriC domain protein n=1 Tax=Pseudomonas sp. NPDC099000 TaxID=3364488 RepID=UPI00383A3BCC